MKSALVFEKDVGASENMSQLLHWLGYFVVPVFSADNTLRAIRVLSFDVVVLHTCHQQNERRSLAAELKIISPKSTVILVTDDTNEIAAANCDIHGCVSIVLRRPVPLEILRRKLEYGIDGYGTQREYLGPVIGRRHNDNFRDP